MSEAALEHSNAPALVAPKYRPDIDGLRGVAVLAVLGFHAFPDEVVGGFTGVDVFFVISGYLISTIILQNVARGTFGFAQFYARRIRRIFPALLLVLAASLAMGWVALFASELKQLGKHVAGGAGFVSNLLLWNESGYFDEAAELKPLLHLWSLGVEEQFYLVWPPLLWLAWRRKALFPAMAGIALVSFVLCVWLVRESPTAAFYSPATRLWELLLGALLTQRALSGAIPSVSANARSAVGAAMIALGIALTTRETPFPSAWTSLPALGTALVVAAGPAAWINRRILSGAPLVGIGLISYPLYLWHWPLLSFAQIVEGSVPPVLFRVAALIASAILAWLTYLLVERHVRRGRGGAPVVTLLCAAMLVVGYAGYECFRLGGFPSREAAIAESANRFDRPYQQSCGELMRAESREDWCNPGNRPSSPPAIVLIGDSFANAYSPMFAALLGDARSPSATFRQFGRQQCPLLVGYGPPFCRDITRQAMAYIRDTPSVRIVVLASNWPIYQRAKDFEWVGHSERPQAFMSAFDETVAALRGMGKDVVVLLAPPVGSRPRACVARPIRLTSDDHCALPLDLARSRDGTYRETFVPHLKALAVPYFDPFVYFCDGAACKVTDGSRILSADGHHLSVNGGAFLATKARAELLEILRIGQL